MRAVPAALQAHLDAGVTTVCRCWRLERRDGVVLGFTDHDAALTFDGVEHSAMSGLASTGDVARTGFGVGGLEVSGALSAATLDADDLAAGAYDFASVTLWLVNWADVAQRVVLRRGTLGEVRREDGAFQAEVRGPAEALETVRGRVFTHHCDADLGDGRCGFDLEGASVDVTVVAVDGALVTVSGLEEASAGDFSDGVARVTSGVASGLRASIAVHVVDGALVKLRLRTSYLPLAVGDGVRVSPGCDKRFATCADRFANAANFRGFPFLPGNDRAFAYARSAS